MPRLTGSLQPGQTGCLRGGTFRGDVNITRGGTAAAPVRLQSYPGRAGARSPASSSSLLPSVEIARLKLAGTATRLGASGPVVAASDV